MQANDTTLAQPSWTNPKDPTTTKQEEIKAILHNTLDTKDSLSPVSKALLHQIKNNILPTMPMQMHHITTEKFRLFYLCTKEHTALSLSDLHLGYWKAAATNEQLSDILVTILNIAILQLYSLKRWIHVLGLLQEKTQGLLYIHRL